MNRSRREAGVTLVEVVIVGGVLSVVVAAIYTLLGSSTDTYAVGVTKSDLDHRANLILEEVAEVLLYSGQQVIQPAPVAPLSAASITFQESAGFEGGKAVWGDPIVVEFVYDSGEQNDGKDNNGNGLIDEGMLVKRVFAADGTARSTVMTRWVREYFEGEVPNGMDDNGNGLVDERGFCVDKSGELWILRLTVERPDATGRALASTAATTVRPRN
jgi:hypothetical protein